MRRRRPAPRRFMSSDPVMFRPRHGDDGSRPPPGAVSTEQNPLASAGRCAYRLGRPELTGRDAHPGAVPQAHPGQPVHRNLTGASHPEVTAGVHHRRRPNPRPPRLTPKEPQMTLERTQQVIEENPEDHDRGLTFDINTLMSRRKALGLFAVGGIGLLAGCGSSSDDGAAASTTSAATTSAAPPHHRPSTTSRSPRRPAAPTPPTAPTARTSSPRAASCAATSPRASATTRAPPRACR